MKPVVQILLAAAAVLCCATASDARPRPSDRVAPRQIAAPAEEVPAPFITNRTHRVGNVRFTVSNWGYVGSRGRFDRDPCTHGSAESFEYPGRSDVEYLYLGALWVGGVKRSDTLVSVGRDAWSAGLHEFYPDDLPKGEIIERTSRDALTHPYGPLCPDVPYSDNAISEQDFVAVYSDTLVDPDGPWDEIDNRPHLPLGIQVTQSSYAWSQDYADDFIIIDYQIKNITRVPIEAVYLGIIVDSDVGHIRQGSANTDDVTGFVRAVPFPLNGVYLDTVNLAWSADNDGDPHNSTFDYRSATGAIGCRFLRTPHNRPDFSFNWWVAHTNASYDWGPAMRDHPVWYPGGNLGTPWGDRPRYQMMANGEIDYDQWESAIDHQADGWLPPVSNPILADDFADGFDTRFLLSTGPFDLEPEGTLPLTIALVAGADFHTDPRNFESYFDPNDLAGFKSRIDFSSLVRHAQWAGWVYDTPGFDTDGNGTRGNYRIIDGDTIYYSGDGAPDFTGPQPPPVPELRFASRDRRTIVTWNGEASETTPDLFLHKPDLEGYRVYFSQTGLRGDFALLTQRDVVNYLQYRWEKSSSRWQVLGPPLTVDSLDVLYGHLSQGFEFHPDSFLVPEIDQALVDPVEPDLIDTLYYYFAPFDRNLTTDDVGAHRAESLGVKMVRAIRKPYPYAQQDDVMQRDDGTPFRPYYEYEYAVDGLYPAASVFFAVTTFDFGDPVAGVGSQESSVHANATEVLPGFLAASESETRLKPGCYPNPYRLIDYYRAGGWEDPEWVIPDPERARKVTFYNLPDTCTIQIWTLDGDLVRKLDHAGAPGTAEASFHVWNMITRNGQSVETGLYIYSVESYHGSDVGKLVVIR